MSSYKKIDQWRCLLEFIDWRYIQSCWYFQPSFGGVAPLTFSLVQLSPHLLCVNKSTVYMYNTVCKGGGGLETIFRRSLTICIWPDSEPTKLPHQPKQKLRRVGGLGKINTCRKFPLQVKFSRWRHFALVSIQLISQCLEALGKSETERFKI